ncbi:MAG: signal peptidase I [bacterium]|nr:signal peptidase I [bacterium]
MKSNFWQRHPLLSDVLGIFSFVFAVSVGTILINSFLFQTYTVVGGSMENTLHDGDRVIVSRIPATWANLTNSNYKPNRGDVIVFKNPHFTTGQKDQYIIKRVIAFAGEKVKVENGKMTVYNKEHPDGFDVDKNFNNEPKKYTSHDGEWTVPEDEIFVSGDNREGSGSYDSRSGLGTIPLYQIVGPVALRIFPFNGIRNFTYSQDY